MTALIDSWAWLEYFFGSGAGKKVASVIEDDAEKKIVTKVNLFEVYHKILGERSKAEAVRFTEFIQRTAKVSELDNETIFLAAEIKKEKRLAMADAMIIATAIKNNATIYTGDKDYKKVTETPVVFVNE